MASHLHDEFVRDVERAAKELETTPSTLIQKAAKRGGRDWTKWKDQTSTPTLKTADQIRAYITDQLPNFVFGEKDARDIQAAE